MRTTVRNTRNQMFIYFRLFNRVCTTVNLPVCPCLVYYSLYLFYTRKSACCHKHTRGVQKILQLDHKKNGNVTSDPLFMNIITIGFSAFATFFWQTVNSTKIEIFCRSLQPLFDSFLQFLERFVVRIADATKVRLHIAKQKIVTGSQVRTDVCRVV